MEYRVKWYGLVLVCVQTQRPESVSRLRTHIVKAISHGAQRNVRINTLEFPKKPLFCHLRVLRAFVVNTAVALTTPPTSLAPGNTHPRLDACRRTGGQYRHDGRPARETALPAG